MTRRRIGLSILNLAGFLVIAGSCYDLLVPTVPRTHLTYLGDGAGPLPRRFAELDLGMLRAIGGCLLAIGVTSLLLTNGPVRRGERWARIAVLVPLGVSDSIDSYQLARFGSPWY